MNYLENLLLSLTNYIVFSSLVVIVLVLLILIFIWLISLFKENKKFRFYAGLSVVIHLFFFAYINPNIPIKYITNTPIVVNTIDDLEYNNIAKLYSKQQNNTKIHSNPNNKRLKKIDPPTKPKNTKNINPKSNTKKYPVNKKNTKIPNNEITNNILNDPITKLIDKPPNTFENFKKLKGINDNTNLKMLHKKGSENHLHSKKREYFNFKQKLNTENQQNLLLKSFDKFTSYEYISKLFYEISTTWFYTYGQHPIKSIFSGSYKPGSIPVRVRFDVSPKGKIKNFKFVFSGKPPEYNAVKLTFKKMIKMFNIKPPKGTHYENLYMTFLLSQKEYDPMNNRDYLWGYTNIEGDTVYDKK